MPDKPPLTKHCHSRSVSQEVRTLSTSELYPNLTFCGDFFLVSHTILFSNCRKAQLLVHVCSWFWQLPLRHIMCTHAHPLCLSEEISYFNLYLPLASHAHPFFFSFQYLITNAWLPVTFLSSGESQYTMPTHWTNSIFSVTTNNAHLFELIN